MDKEQRYIGLAGGLEQFNMEYSSDSTESSKMELEVVLRYDAERILFGQQMG